MNNTNELINMLNGYFNWNKARMSCLAMMLIALIKTQTVNLKKLAKKIPGEAKLLSKYQRLQRFFREFEIDFIQLAHWIMLLFGLSEVPVYLAIDRTNWQWGKSNINILMLSIVYKGIGIPILWKLLPKKGQSDTSERIEILQRFINTFGKDKIAGLLADREFVGQEWFSYLLKEGIPFFIRIKNNSITTNSRGEVVQANVLFRDLMIREKRILSGQRKLWGHLVYLSCIRLDSGELLIVASNQLLGDLDPIGVYSKRWSIELLFGCLKSRGFNFEDTHITDMIRIEKLIALLAIAFCWAHKVGEWEHKEKPIEIKKHGRPAQSIFRYGLDVLDTCFSSATSKITKQSRKLLHFLHVDKSYFQPPASIPGVNI
jgi:hypothetical protein